MQKQIQGLFVIFGVFRGEFLYYPFLPMGSVEKFVRWNFNIGFLLL